MRTKDQWVQSEGRRTSCVLQSSVQCIVALGLLLASFAGLAGTNDFLGQSLTLPAGAEISCFADVDRDGRSDLLTADSKLLRIYHQRESGFGNTPDQLLELRPQTAWVAPSDVDTHPGLELVLSTATGVVYYRRNGGIFETTPRPLISAAQVFTNHDSPVLLSLTTNSSLPIISRSEAVVYQRGQDYQWSPGATLPLEMRRPFWQPHYFQWTLGPNPSRTLVVQKRFRAYPVEDDAVPEESGVRKLIETLKKRGGPQHEPDWSRVDANGDGRKDYVLWQVVGEIDPRTDVYLFLREPDGRLPERPTQIVRARGIPVPVGGSIRATPVGLLKSKGAMDLVLLELKTRFTSVSSLLETALSRGLDWALTIRAFQQVGFSRAPNATIPVTSIIPVMALEQWPFFICGDFNGDGRPDLVVRRSTTQWDIQFSTTDGSRFAPQPAMSFVTAMPGYFEFSDLNGDGRSDIILREVDGSRMAVFLTRTMRNQSP